MKEIIPSPPSVIRNEQRAVQELFRKHVVPSYGRFDVVFCFGLLYHLRYPLMALDGLSAICDGEIFIESAILDDYSPYRGGLGKGYPGGHIVAEFYPGAQYGGNQTNWWAPTLHCLGALVQAAGFPAVQAWKLTDEPKDVSHCRGFAHGTKNVVR